MMFPTWEGEPFMPSIFAPKPGKPEPEPEPTPIEAHPLTESEQIGAWNFLMLLDLGFSIEQGLTLIAIPRFSWHDALALRKKGMPHEYVVNELTP